MPPLLLGGDGRGWLRAQRRRGMQGARTPKGARSTGSSRRAAPDTGPAHHGLAGTNGAAIDGLAGNRSGAARRHAGPRSLLLNLPRRRTSLLLLQARHHVGARGHHGTGCRLSREIWARLRTQRRSWSGARHWRGRFACGLCGAGGRLGRNSHRRRRQRGCRSGRRQGLPRSRQDLSGTGRRNGARRNRTGTQRWMQRRGAPTGGERRSERRRLAAKRFVD
jgi:hypothetical protein